LSAPALGLARTPAFYAPVTAGVAVLAGATLAGRPVGLGLALTVLALLGAAAAAAPARDPLLWLPAAALALMPAIRAAGWVQALSLLGALLLAGLAVGGFTTVREALATTGRGLVSLAPGPFLLAGALTARLEGRWARTLPAVRGTLLAVAVAAPFAALFAAADAAFAEWLDAVGGVFPALGDDVGLRLFIAFAVLAVAGALLRLALSARRVAVPGAPLVGRTEWAIALGALNALFAAFVALQLASLFGGHDFVQRTAGLTYAEYAREGFGQLVAVAALTLVVIGAARRWTARGSAGEERLQRLLLGGLCALTLVVLVSAHHRLGLYLDAFGATRDRAFAQWEILWLGALFVALMAGARARGLVAVTGIALVLLGAADPDRRVAERNVDRYHATGHLDVWTITTLSADAVPAIRRLPPSLRDCLLAPTVRHDGLAGANLSRHHSRGLTPQDGGCAASS
jgi:hypothetical protein